MLVHGLGYARWGWEPVADALAERFELILLDNRGIGASEAPPGPYAVGPMAADVAHVMDDAGIGRKNPTITYCQGGIRAAHAAFALELMGYENVRVYDGSMQDWANRDDTPLVK